jgi:hypothetical protein
MHSQSPGVHFLRMTLVSGKKCPTGLITAENVRGISAPKLPRIARFAVQALLSGVRGGL